MNQSTNRLAHETSPYLLQHQHNPVDWYPWSTEAFDKARAENKPLILSVGYSACHWCHVMEHESFEDDHTARLMNDWFVSVKVDREERPDVDAIYMQAVQALTGHGGWPMTVFLTPDGQPFYGGTYFPPEPRHGLPGFKQVLQAMHDVWQTRHEEAVQNAQALTQHLQTSAQVVSGSLGPTVLDQAVQTIMGQFDAANGGWSSAPKFPAPQTIDVLLRAYQRTHDDEALRQVEFTLQRMAYGGIYDQVGGGFHRYSVDAQWLVPHFEKMLYDNAQLTRAYLHAFQVTGNPEYQRIVEETLDYVVREMTAPDGGYYSAQDADSAFATPTMAATPNPEPTQTAQGETGEGVFYVWTLDEVRQALGQDASLFAQIFDVSAQGNWEGHTILRLKRPLADIARVTGQPLERLQDVVERGKQALFAIRETRPKPSRDDKVLTSWNGLMLQAMAEAGRVLGSADYLDSARRNAEFVLNTLYDGTQLRHSYKDGRVRAESFAADYALYAAGLLELYRATFELRWLDTAQALIDHLLERFWDDEKGGFFQTGDDHEQLIARPKELFDEAVPSPNAVAAHVLLQLANLSSEPRYEARARQTMELVARALDQYPSAFATMLNAIDMALATLREVAIIGDLEHSDTQAMLRALDQHWRPNLVVVAAQPSDTAAQQRIPLLRDRPQRDGKATAYVCQNFVCNLPTTEVETMLAQGEGGDDAGAG